MAVASVIGIPIGLIEGYLGGWTDEILGRMIDSLLSFPGIVLAIGVTSAFGIGLTNGMIAVGIVFSPRLARLARGQAIIVKSELYVDAARGFGASPWRTIRRHILPNAIQPVIVEISRVSKPRRRVYSSIKDLKPVKNGLGISILSTPKGVMSDNAARDANVGGEVLCRVY